MTGGLNEWQTGAAARAERQLDRLTFFSDAVFAIAMTLLVIEVRLPAVHSFDDAALAQSLIALVPNYVGFVVSFFVLARFWAAHHRVMGLLKAASPQLVWANLFLLSAVAFMPFPTRIISEFVQLRVGVGFYTAWLVLLALLNRHVIKVANDPALIADESEVASLVAFRRTSLIPLLIGASAFVLGMITPLASLLALTIGSPLIAWLIRRGSASSPNAAK